MTTRKPQRMSRRVRTTRPHLEPLDRRALMAYTALDPTFGAGGVVAIPGSTSAVIAQADGKALVAGVISVNDGGTSTTVADVARYNADGSLDTTFGTNGRASIPNFGSPDAIALLPDGSIAVAGEAVVPNNDTLTAQGAVARLTPGGQLDTTFGSGGVVLLPTDAAASVSRIAAQADGSLVLAGASSIVSGTTRRDAVVVRLTSTGAFDTTFNNTGIVDLTVPYYSSAAVGTTLTIGGVAVDKDGRIVLGGTTGEGISVRSLYYTGFVARLGTTGSLDTTFGSAGIVSGPGQDNGLAVQDDGKVVVVGTNVLFPYDSFGYSPPTLTRLNLDGSVDPTFAANGPILASLTGQNPTLNSIAIGPGGEITVAGRQAGPTLSAQNDRTTLVARFTADGRPDTSFGLGGAAQLRIKSPASTVLTGVGASEAFGVATTTTGQVLVVGSSIATAANNTEGVLARVLPVAVRTLANDHDLDGKSDLAAYLPTAGLFAVRPSDGRPDVVLPFGSAGVGGSIPVAGDYDGDGAADTAVYLPASGQFAVVPSGGADAYLFAFGSAGAGASIPVAGDYDGDGKTDFAVYLPAAGQFAVMPSGGTPAYLAPFGSAGPGGSIPLAGDFDGDGKTDIAVYLPATGQFAIKPSDGAPAYLAPFGSAGPGGSIPVAGDYDGDGKTDFAVYLPAAGSFAIEPSDGSAAYLVPFGGPGAGATLPVAPAPTISLAAATVGARSFGVPGGNEDGVSYFLSDENLASLIGKKKPAGT